jgi:hypothetical protein
VRPCKRCLQCGTPDQCVDAPSKKRGRKKKVLSEDEIFQALISNPSTLTNYFPRKYRVTSLSFIFRLFSTWNFFNCSASRKFGYFPVVKICKPSCRGHP